MLHGFPGGSVRPVESLASGEEAGASRRRERRAIPRFDSETMGNGRRGQEGCFQSGATVDTCGRCRVIRPRSSRAIHFSGHSGRDG